ncbi:MAG: cytidylate kinase-like family protein [Oscillospiraceae bacterium]|nr:cytidylate kinase-like family protein [Oscillospiraceae bacterium]
MIITIARQYGSAGKEIGEKLAERLGYQFYDREVLDIAADSASIHPEVAARFDQKPVRSLLYNAYMTSTAEESLPLNQKLALAEFDAIRTLSEQGNCVFVGRCADMVLKKRSDVIRVFLHAPLEWRKEYIMKIDGVPEQLVEKTVKRGDKTRAEYYEFFTQRKWGDVDNYDLSINVAFRGIDGTIDLLAGLVEGLR